MIGDAPPHESDEALAQMRRFGVSSPHAIDWRTEADNLWKKGIKVYAVQCLGNSNSTFFYKALAGRTVGTFVELRNFNIVKDMILSICFREVSPELMRTYEKEIIAEGRMTKEMHRMIRQVSKEISKEVPEQVSAGGGAWG